MDRGSAPYYRRDLALVHHRGFGEHADACAPGIVELLAPVRERDGLVVELGCGSGLLTRHLLDAGHRVVATDASPAMLELARAVAPEAEDVRQLVLPDDPIPAADAIVSVGHVPELSPRRGRHRPGARRHRRRAPDKRCARDRPVRPRMGRSST